MSFYFEIVKILKWFLSLVENCCEKWYGNIGYSCMVILGNGNFYVMFLLGLKGIE